ncbi:MAG TPA: glycosyltransferase 87 family protein [Polyangia bacterium]|nr:glycosyltransferase 87 family protein [Polyangia bacterium]
MKPGTARAGRLGLAAVGAAVLVAQLVVWLPVHARRADVAWMDVSVYLRVARHAAAGEPLYDECKTFHLGDPPSCFYYPPVLAVALMPLARAAPATAQAVWYAGELVAFWLFAFGLVRLAGMRTTALHVLAAGALVELFPGTVVTMSLGNVDLWVWALCALALGGRGAGAMGLAAALKVYPAWGVATALARRTPSAWRGVALAVVACAAAALVVGVRGFRDWTLGLGVLASGLRVPTNVSLSLALASLVGAGSAFLVAAPLVGPPLVAVVTRRLDARVSIGLVLVASVLLAPLCWWYYAPILLIPGAAAWRARSATEAIRRQV